MKTNKLWTRNFTIITLGTVVSMLGSSISGFAISLLILDYTGSVLLYSLYMVAYNLPRIILPMVAGPYLDNFSRAKVIYSLDFLSAGLFAVMYLVIGSGYFSYPVFLLVTVLIGSIDSIYQVAYESLYPMLVSEGNFTKAYSISSLLYPFASMMVPVAAIVYNTIGLAPLFLANSISFLVAAIFETQIRVDESQIQRKQEKVSFTYLRNEFTHGMEYIRSEPGLMVITAYFFVTTMTGSASSTLWLPYFQSIPALGALMYSYVSACNVAGRLVGGLVHYRFKYPTHKKFAIALFVYTVISFLDGSALYMPVALMMLLFFLSGCLAVTSYNIRLSTTQSYVPNEFRGRFNGSFQMVCTFGSIIGQLVAGALGDHLPIRPLVVIFMVINLIAVFAIVYRGREHVKLIYNRDV